MLILDDLRPLSNNISILLLNLDNLISPFQPSYVRKNLEVVSVQGNC